MVGRQHLIDHSSIVGHGLNIKPSSIVRLLGVYVDETMNYEIHVGNVVRTCFFQLRQLKAIRSCIPLDTAKTFVNTFVVTRLAYYNSLLDVVPSCQLDRLQSVSTPLPDLHAVHLDMTISCLCFVMSFTGFVAESESFSNLCVMV